MSVGDLDETPTVVLLHRTLAFARSEPVLQSDEYWTHVQALHFRGACSRRPSGCVRIQVRSLVRSVQTSLLRSKSRREPASQTTRSRTNPHRSLLRYLRMGHHRSRRLPFMLWAIWERVNGRTFDD